MKKRQEPQPERVDWVLPPTPHFLLRASQRNYSPRDVAYIFQYGRVIYRTGVVYHYLGREDVRPADRKLSWVMRLAGTALLVKYGSQLWTIYRPRHGMRPILALKKYDAKRRRCRAGWDWQAA